MPNVRFRAGLIGLLAGGSLLMLPAGNAQQLSGQVSQEDDSFFGAIHQNLTLTPGPGTFSADHLRFGRQVAMTLYNPNAYPMRFDTVQRIGKELSWVVPANSQKTVSFRYFNPVSDEVRFLVYQDPASLAISNGSVTQPQPVAEVGPSAPVAQEPTPASSMQEAEQPQQPQPQYQQQDSSAVRGYW